MANPKFTVGDTWPYLRGAATDENGMLDLSIAVSITAYLVSPGHTITGPVVGYGSPYKNVGDPASLLGFNWDYKWAIADTSNPGTYTTWIKVVWDSGTTPPEVQFFQGDTFTIVAAPS